MRTSRGVLVVQRSAIFIHMSRALWTHRKSCGKPEGLLDNDGDCGKGDRPADCHRDYAVSGGVGEGYIASL